MNYKFGYTVPLNIKIFKSNFDYYQGIGTLSKDECIDRSLLVSGVKLVDSEAYEHFIEEHALEKIFK